MRYERLEVGRVTYAEENKPVSVLVFYLVWNDDTTGLSMYFRAEAPRVSVQSSSMGALKKIAIPLWADTI